MNYNQLAKRLKFKTTDQLLLWTDRHSLQFYKVKTTTSGAEYLVAVPLTEDIVEKLIALRVAENYREYELGSFPTLKKGYKAEPVCQRNADQVSKPSPPSVPPLPDSHPIASATVEWIEAKALEADLDFPDYGLLIHWLLQRNVRLELRNGILFILKADALSIIEAYRRGMNGWIGLQPPGLARNNELKENW